MSGQSVRAASRATLADGYHLTDRYQVLERLGRGGVGSVYVALDRATDTRVALKTRNSEGTAPAEVAEALLQREYHVLRQLAHPNVVRAFDFGVSEHGGFYTMELLPGNLRGSLPLPYRRCAEIARDVCSALALMHSRRLLHRDVGTRNVRCDDTGRAKLIDFGAIQSMGPSLNITGTPPAMSPESVRGEPLDGRSDLYAVGALLYHLLTGQHAYPARRVRDLFELWKSPTAPPSALVPGLPAALDQLTLALLSSDPSARPRTAGEVIDRLCALADLEVEDPEAARRAYLLTPDLVGRGDELARVEQLAARHQRGESLLAAISGAPGSGRSRLLESCALAVEVKGGAVLRARAGELPGDAFAVIGALCAGAQEHGFTGDPADAARALQGVAAQRPLLIAIDDIERCDEASLAVLIELAAQGGAPGMWLAFTHEAEESRVEGIALLRELAETLECEALSELETERLLGSVFGEVPGLRALTRFVHAVAQGNPRTSMLLAQHLVDRGDARFEQGTWQLPLELAGLSLPGDLEQTLIAQLSARSPNARRLARLLALSSGAALPLPALIELGIAHASESQGQSVFDALDELTMHQVVVQRGGDVRLRHAAFAEVLARDLSDGERARLHELLACSARDRGEQAVLVAHHLQAAGLHDQALDVLRPGLRAHVDPGTVLSPDDAQLWASVLGHAIESAKRRKEHPALLHALLLRQNSIAMTFEVQDRFAETFELLAFDIGLDLYGAMDPALPAVDRIRRALADAGARREALPETERGLKPLSALLRLVITSVRAYFHAMNGLDFERLQRIRATLSPLRVLSPAIALIHDYITVGEASIRGRNVLPQLHELLRRLEAKVPDLDPTQATSLEASLRYHIGIDAARRGDPSLELAHAISADPHRRDLGAVLEMFVHLSQGRFDDAERARSRMRALRTRALGRRYLASALYNEVIIYALTDHATGLKRALPRVRELAERQRGWEPVLALAQGALRAALGDLEPGLSAIDRALELTAPGEHLVWPVAAPLRTRLLLELGRAREARVHAEEAFEQAEMHRLQPYILAVLRASVATACAAAGAAAAALRHAEQASATLDGAGVGGTPELSTLALCASAAARAGERAAFERYLERAQTAASRGGPELHAFVERLRRAGELRGIASAPPPPREVTLGTEVTTTSRGPRTRTSRGPRTRTSRRS